MKTLITILLITLLMPFEGISQCENIPMKVSTTQFNCTGVNGELCFSFNYDNTNYQCEDYVLEVTIDEGAFNIKDAGEFYAVSQTGDKINLRLEPIPFIGHSIVETCIALELLSASSTVSYRLFDPVSNNEVRSESIKIPDDEIQIGSPGSSITVTQAIALDLLEDPATAANTAQSVYIEGTLIVDQDYSFASSFDYVGNIHMGSGAEIVVNDNIDFEIRNAKIYSCSQWEGINLGKSVSCSIFNSDISDAKVAVELEDDNLFRCGASNFDKNEIAIGSFGSQEKNVSMDLFAPFLVNRFTNGDQAIHLEHTNGLIMTRENVIDNMSEYGIYLDHSDAIINGIAIKNCQKSGIYAFYYELGKGLLDARKVSFRNTGNAIEIGGYHMSRIEDCDIEECNYAMRKFEMRESSTNFINNEIRNTTVGFYGMTHANTFGNIQYNIIDAESNNVYLLGAVGKNTWATQNNRFNLNPTNNNGFKGIVYRNMHKGRIFENTIIAESADGLLIEGGSFNTVVRNNMILLDAQSRFGISLTHSPLGFLKCNNIYDFEQGIEVLGGCEGSTVEKNDLSTRWGLDYGNPSQGFANTGTQYHKSNIFLPSTPSTLRARNYSDGRIAINNQYIVPQHLSQGSVGYPYFNANIDDWFNPEGYGSIEDCSSNIADPNDKEELIIDAFEGSSSILDDVLEIYGENIAFGIGLNLYRYGQRSAIVQQNQIYQNFLFDENFADALALGEVIYDIEKVLYEVALPEQDYLNWRLTFNHELDNIHSILSLDSPTLNNQDYIISKATIDQVKNEWVAQIENGQSIIDHAVPLWKLQLENLELDIEAAQLTRTIYILYLDFLHSSFNGFSPTEKSDINSISERCIYEYAASVPLARYLRAYYDDKMDYIAENANCLGIENRSGEQEESNFKQLNLFPNPVHNILFLNVAASENETFYTIYNTKGELVQDFIIEKEVQQKKVDVSALHPGIYYIKSKTDGSVEKFVKIQ